MTTARCFTVLIVDDEPDICDFVAMEFELAGYEVILAHDGLEALNLLKQHPVDVIVSDIRMPHKNGRTLFNEVSKLKGGQIPFFFMTGYPDLTEQEATNIGANGFFSKPFDVGAMVQTVTHCLRGKTP